MSDTPTEAQKAQIAAAEFNQLVDRRMAMLYGSIQKDTGAPPLVISGQIVFTIALQARDFDPKAGADWLRALAMMVGAESQVTHTTATMKAQEAFVKLVDSANKIALLRASAAGTGKAQ